MRISAHVRHNFNLFKHILTGQIMHKRHMVKISTYTSHGTHLSCTLIPERTKIWATNKHVALQGYLMQFNKQDSLTQLQEHRKIEETRELLTIKHTHACERGTHMRTHKYAHARAQNMTSMREGGRTDAKAGGHATRTGGAVCVVYASDIKPPTKEEGKQWHAGTMQARSVCRRAGSRPWSYQRGACVRLGRERGREGEEGEGKGGPACLLHLSQ
jgi:hypothetical protein